MATDQNGRFGATRARGIAGLFRGGWAMVQGSMGALGNRDVFRVYGRMTLALFLTVLVLGGLMIYGVSVLADLIGDGAWGGAAGAGGTAGDTAGTGDQATSAAEASFLAAAWDYVVESSRYLVYVLGYVLAVVAAPVLSVLVVGLIFPMFADAIFFAALRPLDKARADTLEAQSGLSAMASFITSLRLLLRFLGFTLLAVLVGLIPFVGQLLAPIMTIWVASKTLGWELMQPYFSKRGMKYAEQKQYVKAHGGGMLGFGMPLSFLLAFPLIGPLFFGLAQAGAPKLLVDVLEPKA